eukprot:768356-Rhodomonas_salina.1
MLCAEEPLVGALADRSAYSKVLTTRVRVAGQLIAMGVDANLRNYDGRTALHIACFKGHSKVQTRASA